MNRTQRINIELIIFFIFIFLPGGKSITVQNVFAADQIPAFFTIILLPDTQYYSKTYHETYYKQTQWIADHGDELNIKFVIHLGDITHDNTPEQWQVADKAHKILDESGIPYSMIPGNHDMPQEGEARVRDTANYNLYFGPNRFKGKKWYGGHLGSTNDNNYNFFEHEEFKFMIVCLEFAPRLKTLDWANHLISQHKHRSVIVVTHCYQAKRLVDEARGEGHQIDCAIRYDIEGSGGDIVWEKLVSRHKNIFMVLSGHRSDVEHNIRQGVEGNPVHEILTDYQNERPGGNLKMKKSGNGWLRMLKFVPGENKIYVSPYSVEKEKRYYMTSMYSEDPGHSDHTYSFSYSSHFSYE